MNMKCGFMFRSVILLVITLMISNGIALAQSDFSKDRGESVSKAANRFGQMMYYLDGYYLDTVNFKAAVDAAIEAALLELDPHSSYVRAEDLKEVSEPLEAEFDGIGIEFAIIRDTLTVQGVIEGGPSQKVGLMTGDKIIYVGKELVAGVSIDNEGVRSRLRGKRGTKVALKVLRPGTGAKLLDFMIVRDRVPINSLDAAYECAPGVLYLKLSRFAATSYKELHTAMSDFMRKGVLKGVILDLRGNGGGFLSAAIDIANEFLGRRELIVSTEGRAVSPAREYSDGWGIYPSGPLCVLIDENSASASEIVSGALQDQDRAVVIGRRSFGKGLVQRAFPLMDGSQLRLTIARYHTPSGRVIQSPYTMGDKKGYYENFYRRFSDGELYGRDTLNRDSLPVFRTLKLKRPVYGGGGIMPDVFIPRDSAEFTDYYAALLRNGIVIEFVNRTVDVSRNAWLKKFPDFAAFDAGSLVDDVMLEKLTDYAAGKGVAFVEKDFLKSKDDIRNYMKALIASSLYSRECFYRVMNSYKDGAYSEALKIVADWDASFERIMKGEASGK